MAKSNVSSSLVFLFSFSLHFLLSSAQIAGQPNPVGSASTPASVQIVYTDRPKGEDPEACDIKTLAAVLGSDEAAKQALVHTYTTAASGFSAKLTPDQVEQIAKQPGVLEVAESVTNQLHAGGGGSGSGVTNPY